MKRYIVILDNHNFIFRGVGKPASVLKEAVIKKEFSVHAAITSKNLPQPLLSTGVVYNVLSVTRFDSPSSMVVRLDVSSGCSQRIVNVNRLIFSSAAYL